MSVQTKGMKNVMYKFLSTIGSSLTPFQDDYSLSNNFASAKLKSVFADATVTKSSSFKITTSSIDEVTLPVDEVVKSALQGSGSRDIITRMIKWNNNPYSFAKSSGRVKSSVVSFTVMDKFGQEMTMTNLNSPITIK